MMQRTNKNLHHHDHPRAIAIVLGHLGVDDRTMQGYKAWYTKRNCQVILGTSPVLRFVLNQSLASTASTILEETYQAIQSTPSTVPVIVHLFSNGGAFLLDEMEQQLLLPQQPSQQPESSKSRSSSNMDMSSSNNNNDNNNKGERYALIRERMKNGYHFFDSCPCHIRLLWGNNDDKEIPISQSFPFPSWSSTGRLIYTYLAATSLTLWTMLTPFASSSTSSSKRPRQFWNRRKASRLCLYHVYAYTTADFATDAFALEQLIQYRTKRLDGASCQAYRYEDSSHCRLHHDHPQEYSSAIDIALDAAIRRSATTSSSTVS